MVRKISIEEWEKSQGTRREDPMRVKPENNLETQQYQSGKENRWKKKVSQQIPLDINKLSHKFVLKIVGFIFLIIVLGLFFEDRIFGLFFGGFIWFAYSKFKKANQLDE